MPSSSRLYMAPEGHDYYPWQEGLFRSAPYTIVDGKATIPDVPGWGIEIDDTWLAAANYQQSTLS